MSGHHPSQTRTDGFGRSCQRSRILEAARAIVDGHGSPALTRRRLAATAGVAPEAVGRAFRTRDDLLMTLRDAGSA